MKKLLILLFVLPIILQAQNTWLEQSIKLTAADSNHIKASVSGKALELMAYAKPDSALTSEMEELAKSIHGMVGYMNLSQATMANLLSKTESSNNFDEYARISRNGEIMAMFIKEKDGIVKDAVMLISSKNKNIAVDVYGELDMRLFGKLYKLIPFEEMNHLQHEHDQKDAD